MVRHLREEAAKFELSMHMGKTKLLTNDLSQKRGEHVKIGADLVRILGADEAEKYLGRQVCIQDPTGVELQNRIAAGWAAFSKYRPEL